MSGRWKRPPISAGLRSVTRGVTRGVTGISLAFVPYVAACGRASSSTPAPIASIASTASSVSAPSTSSPSDATAPPASTPAASAAASATVALAADASTATSVPSPGADASAAAGSTDGGAGACRVVRGPIELPLRGPADLSFHDGAIDVVLDDGGHPRLVSFPAGALPRPLPPAGAAAKEPLAGGSAAGLSVPCVTAGDRAFCADRSGTVRRASKNGAGDRVVGSARTGSRIAAGLLGEGHAAVLYTASRQSTEGWVTEAWMAIDDEAPVRVSEDGSGATSVTLAPYGKALVAAMVDARAALTALHARVVRYEGGLHLDDDAVVFVGGPGDRQTAVALAMSSGGPSWALLPIAKDVGNFGLAVVHLDDPPHVDEPTLWSMYPNGLDPASVATAVGGGKTWIARVRPQDPQPFCPRVLELGDLDPKGAFTARDVVPTAGTPSGLSLAFDASGALWLAWVDGGGSWLERLVCK